MGMAPVPLVSAAAQATACLLVMFFLFFRPFSLLYSAPGRFGPRWGPAMIGYAVDRCKDIYFIIFEGSIATSSTH